MLSAQQRRVLSTPGVNYLGRDEKNRPVVSAMTGIPQQYRTWAVLKNGDPTDVTGQVTPPSPS